MKFLGITVFNKKTNKPDSGNKAYIRVYCHRCKSTMLLPLTESLPFIHGKFVKVPCSGCGLKRSIIELRQPC